MTDQLAFERSLEARLVARAEAASHPFDAAEIARAAIARSGAGRRTIAVPSRTIAAWLGVAALLMLLAGIALVAGQRQSPIPQGSILAVGRSEGFFFGTGPDAREIAKGGPYFESRWSRDGRYVAVDALSAEDANHLFIFTAEGQLFGSRTRVVAYEWSPAGDELATLDAAGGSIRILDATGALVDTVEGPVAAPNIRMFSWAPDGRRLFVSASTGFDATTSSFWIVSRDAAPVQPLEDDLLAFPAWSSDGTLLAATWQECPEEDCERQVRMYDLASRAERGELQDVLSPNSLMWSPVSKVLAYDALTDASDPDRSREVWAYDFDRNTLTRLTANIKQDYLVGWLPDGTGVIVRRQDPTAGAGFDFLVVPLDATESLLVKDAYGVGVQPRPWSALTLRSGYSE